jgi:hypothetical protein
MRASEVAVIVVLGLLVGGLFLPSRAQAQACPANSEPYSTEGTPTGTITHCQCISGYVLTNGSCQLQPAATQLDCEAVQQQAERDRAAIERLRATNEMNQEELSDWTNMTKRAQKDALWAAVDFAMADYAADAERAATSVSKLQTQVAFLTKKATKSHKQKTRLKYLVELQQARAALTRARVVHVSKKIVESAASADDAWKVARGTMENEFRVAAKHDSSIRDQLREPGFREAFTGDPNDSPTTEVLETLSDQAIDDISKAALTAGQYEKLAGPTVRAAIFVRDSAYSALESILSTQRVLQAADVAGKLAQASGVMQERYKKSIDALRTCRTTAR